jgi:Rhodopirellula transposase DDE domain
MDADIVWTDITPSSLVKYYAEKEVKLSVYTAKELFTQKRFKRRQMSKKGTIKDVANRDAQFNLIGLKKTEFIAKNLPVLSIDTKKKEFIGNLYREGKCYTKESALVYDHDFPSLAKGVLIPHGIFDMTKNKGYISIGQNKDTSEFLVDNIKYHWQNHIQKDYQDAKEMLLLMDGGGSNSCLHYIVKEDLQKLANELKITIDVAHYPAYCSKYNPIEHRLFPHIQRTWKGIVFDNYQIVKELIEKTTTSTGLKVVAWINEKVYMTGRKYAENFKENMEILFDDVIPKWNYKIKPL